MSTQSTHQTLIGQIAKHLGAAKAYARSPGLSPVAQYGMVLGELQMAGEIAGCRYPRLRNAVLAAEAELGTPGQLWMPRIDEAIALLDRVGPGEAGEHPRTRTPDAPSRCAERERRRKERMASRQENASKVVAQRNSAAQKAADDARAKQRLYPKRHEVTRGKLILLTALADFRPSYSLTSVIVDQAIAASMAGYSVHLVGMQGMGTDVGHFPQECNIVVDRVFRNVPWAEDKFNRTVVDGLKRDLTDYLGTFEHEATPVPIITHDLCFVSWYLNMAHAIHELSGEVGVADRFVWYHQIHSCVSDQRPSGDAEARALLPEGHHLIVENPGEVKPAAAYYRIAVDKVTVLPVSRDFRTWGTMSSRVKMLVEHLRPHLREYVQIYPLSTPRAMDKGLAKVIDLFARIKSRLGPVCLIIANAHANSQEGLEMVNSLRRYAADKGLQVDGEDGEVAFTSQLLKGTECHGLAAAEIQELMRYSNVFAFPSISEAAGLCMLEAQLMGCKVLYSKNIGSAHYASSDDIPVDWRGGVDLDQLVDEIDTVTPRKSILAQLSLEYFATALIGLLADEVAMPSSIQRGCELR